SAMHSGLKANSIMDASDVLEQEAEEPVLHTHSMEMNKMLSHASSVSRYSSLSSLRERREAFRTRKMAKSLEQRDSRTKAAAPVNRHTDNVDRWSRGEAMGAGGGGRVKADFRSGLEQVPVVREGASLDAWQQMWSGNLEKLMSLQAQDKGSWELQTDLGRLLCIDVEACKQLLQTAGIRSFGATAASELEELLATVLVLLALCVNRTTRQSPDEIMDFLKAALAGKASLNAGKFALVSRWMKNVEKAVQFCRAMDARHPLACSSMELAPDWLSLGARLFGLV
ncbi:hypothetical protein BaRGS_00022120, partial [Batillaria attramentaria]